VFSRISFFILIILFFLVSLSGCKALKENRQYLLEGAFPVKPPPRDVIQVAVLPVQNATFHPIRITGKQNFITRFMEEFLNEKLKFDYAKDDVHYVQKSLQSILTQRLYNSGYRVLDPGSVRSIFVRQGTLISGSEMNIPDITQNIPADWLLLVTLTKWEGGSYDRRGKGKLSYQTTLVDTRLKQSIWEKEDKDHKFYAPHRHLPYNRQAGDTLNEIGKRILKGMPEPEKVTDYEAMQQPAA